MKTTGHLIKQDSGILIADAISSAIHSGELKPGDKLCGESELARQYSATVYSVRKALRKLKNDGYLYSIPKNGVFVSALQERSVQHPETNGNIGDFRKLSSEAETETIQFCTNSTLPSQLELFQKITSSFDRTSLTSNILIIPDTDRVTGHSKKGDLYEFSSESPCYRNLRNLMDMKKYFSETVKHRDLMIDNTGIPFYYSLPIMLYNKEILRQLGFGEKPIYHDYDSMTQYLDEVTSAVACNPEFSLPGTTQNMIYKLGNSVNEFLRDIRNTAIGETEFRDKYSDLIRKITKYWKKYHISYPRRQLQHLQNFVEGKTPFFFGFSSYYLYSKNLNPDLPCGASVMYSHDQTVSGSLAVLAIDSESPNILETIRAAQHFQKEEFQIDLAKNGLCPFQPEFYRYMPYDNAGSCLKLAECIREEDYYIAMNVVNVELWNIVLFDKNIEEAIHDILVFSRSFLEMSLDHAIIAKQNHWAELYF